MNNILLPFKYSCLNFSEAYNANKLKQLGWKLRKYQNWEEVYSDKDDKQVMRDFADKAIDEKILAEKYLPNIQGILLNVKRWSMDKENMSDIEPDHQEDWDFASTRLTAITQNPSVAIKILKERYPKEDELFASVGIGFAASRLLVARLINSGLKITSSFSKEDYFDTNHDEFISIVSGTHSNILECRILRESSSIFECCEMLGLPNIEDIEYPDSDQVELKAREIVFTKQALAKHKFLEVIKSDRIVNVKINENHRYFKNIQESGYYPELERFLSAYALASLDIPASQSEMLEDFGFYLSKRLEEV